jgi:hypothetical protein
MKQLLIGSLVGAIILFLWQFMSWTTLNIHQSSMQYTANQDAVLECLAANLEEGSYFMPNLPPNATEEEYEANMKNVEGKPWAQVSYHKSMEYNMGMSMFRGFAIDFVAVLLLCWLLMKFEHNDFKTTLLSTLAVGVIAFLTTHYLDSIWFESSSIGHLIDTIVQWGLCGAWLGWWMNRN